MIRFRLIKHQCRNPCRYHSDQKRAAGGNLPPIQFLYVLTRLPAAISIRCRTHLDLCASFLTHRRSKRAAREPRSLVRRDIADGVATIRAAHLHARAGLAVAQRTRWVATHEFVHLGTFAGQVVEPDHCVRPHAPVLHTCVQQRASDINFQMEPIHGCSSLLNSVNNPFSRSRTKILVLDNGLLVGERHFHTRLDPHSDSCLDLLAHE